MIFDDDNRKLKLAIEVLASLKSNHGSHAWSLGFCNRIKSTDVVMSFLEKLNAPDVLVILDIEIKTSDDEVNWRNDSVLKIKSLLCSSEKEAYEAKYSSLTATYGDFPDYQLSLALLAFLLIRRIPVITISTKPNAQDDVTPNMVKAISENVPYIPNWSESWETSWTIPERKVELIAGIARMIHCEWEKWRGTMSARIWGGDQCLGSRMDWFKREQEHAHMKHDFPSRTPTSEYLANMRGFLNAVINKGKTQPIDFSEYQITHACHEAIKSLIGAVSNADFAKGDKCPQLNTVVLLAAAWDPNAASWFPAFNWEALHHLMCEDASREELRSAILAIGGEEGLFQAKLIDKFNNTANAAGNWTPCQSSVKHVTATSDTVTIEFKFELSKLSTNFQDAKDGKPYTGGTCSKLVTAWKALATQDCRTVDIEIEGDKLKFFKFTRP